MASAMVWIACSSTIESAMIVAEGIMIGCRLGEGSAVPIRLAVTLDHAPLAFQGVSSRTSLERSAACHQHGPLKQKKPRRTEIQRGERHGDF